MPQKTVCKIVRQYNKEPVSAENMQKLKEIAEDYRQVKNHVYRRYGGIRSLSKLYPGYTVQNEMTKSGLREKLGLPSVYFYLAVFDALRDIKSLWTRTKSAVLKKMNASDSLTEDEKHFIRYLLKVSNAFDAVLNGVPLKLPGEMQKQYDLLAALVDVKKAESYLRRQVRRCHGTLHADTADGFSIAERAYRYGDHGIYISVKEKRKRIFIPLTDGNSYTRQLRICLYPEEGKVELLIPVDVPVKARADYTGHVGLAMGMRAMLVTDEGHVYGEAFSAYQEQLSDWIREQRSIYSQNRNANPGRKKYKAKKHRLEEQLHSYINQELNRFLKTEKPKVIYLPKFPKPQTSGYVKRINHLVSTWQRGYIRGRLSLKCREQSIELVEIFAKNISNECSQCGAMGRCEGETFFCLSCRYSADRKVNAAKNAKKRGGEQWMDHKDRFLDE